MPGGSGVKALRAFGGLDRFGLAKWASGAAPGATETGVALGQKKRGARRRRA